MNAVESLFFALYSALMWCAQPLLRRKLARRAHKEPGYGVAINERFGRYSQRPAVGRELVWVHAVSLGETRAAAVLLKALRRAHPGLRVLLTHGTATGRAEGAALLQPGDIGVWQPWDSSPATARFFKHFQPRLGLLIETEVWPNAMAAAKAGGVPVVLVNARLSVSSLAAALRIAPLALPAYRALAAVLAQTSLHAERFAALGLSAQVVGSLKFDATPDLLQLAQGQHWRRTLDKYRALGVLLLASSREGEEKPFFEQIAAIARLSASRSATDSIANENMLNQRLHVLVVPRHPQRFDDVAALAAASGLRVSRRSQWPAAGPAASAEAMAAQVWLGDSLGEMALYYALADVALLGGSFAPLGGQNLIEAAACGCPVVMGPHTFNFAEAAEQAEAGGAALRAPDLPAAVQAAGALLADTAARAAASAAGLAFARRNQGATQRTVAALAPWLAPDSRR